MDQPAKIILSYVLGGGIASAAIAWFSAGYFSHVDAILPGGWRLGSRSGVISVNNHAYPAGVQIRPAGYEVFKRETVIEVPATDGQSQVFWQFCKSQIGKMYDHTAIWAFALDRNWHDTSAWYCSELITAAEETAGLLKFAPANKITPVMSYRVNRALGATIVKGDDA